MMRDLGPRKLVGVAERPSQREVAHRSVESPLAWPASKEGNQLQLPVVPELEALLHPEAKVEQSAPVVLEMVGRQLPASELPWRVKPQAYCSKNFQDSSGCLALLHASWNPTQAVDPSACHVLRPRGS